MIADKEWMKKYIGYEDNKTYPTLILHMFLECNVNCSICYVRHGGTYAAIHDGERLNDEALEKVVKYAAEHNQTLYTGTGEPFLFWNEYTKPKLIPLVKKYNAKCVISTNGLWGNNDEIIQDIINLEVPCICFSVDYWHKVPLENINHAIEALSDSDVKTQIFMAQITDDKHPIGHIKPINYDRLLKVEFPLDRNSNSNQGMSFHDRDGNIVFTSQPTTCESSLRVFV